MNEIIKIEKQGYHHKKLEDTPLRFLLNVAGQVHIGDRDALEILILSRASADIVVIIDKRRGAVKRSTYLQALLWDSLLTKIMRPDDVVTGYDCFALGVRGGGQVAQKED